MRIQGKITDSVAGTVFDTFKSNVILAAAYVLTHVKTGKFYIGSTGNIYKRLTKHKNYLEKGLHSNKPLQAVYAISPDFTLEVFIELDRETALDREQILLDMHSGSELLLNRALNARLPALGISRTDDEKKAISLFHTGKVVSEETREKLREANIGKTHSDETKRKLSEINKHQNHNYAAIVAFAKANRGVKKDPSIGAKISLAKKGVPKTANERARLRRMVMVRARGVLIDGVCYESLEEAGRTLGLTAAGVKYRINATSPQFDNWKWATTVEKE